MAGGSLTTRRGFGAVYLPTYKDKRTGELRQSSVWWIQYSIHGQRKIENSHSRNRTDALKLLKKRLGEIDGRLIVSAVERTGFQDLAELFINDYEIKVKRFLELSASGQLGFGECSAIAVAAFRQLPLAIDDKAARKRASSGNPKVPLLDTDALMVSLIQAGRIRVPRFRLAQRRGSPAICSLLLRTSTSPCGLQAPRDRRPLGSDSKTLADGRPGFVIYETAPGGSGHCRELVELERDLLLAAREILRGTDQHHQRCERACLDCLLDFAGQFSFERLDRRGALEIMEAGFAQGTI